MSKIKLTRAKVNALQPPPPGKQQAFYRDAGLQGFGVYVTSGGVKTYFLETTLKGRNKRWKLGRVGQITLEEARAKCVEWIKMVAEGIDPEAEERQELAKKITLQQALDDFLAARTSMARRAMKEKTASDYRSTLAYHAGKLLTMEIVKIRRDKMLALHQQVSREHPATADKLARYLRAVINFARLNYTDETDEPVIHGNPVDVLRRARAWNNVPRRTRTIQTSQMPAWFEAVQRLRETSQAGDLLLLLLLTGLRLNEALGLEWRDVDFINRTLTARETKNHTDHTIPVCDYILNLLKHRHSVHGGSAVFPSSGKGGKLTKPHKQLVRIAEESGVEFTAHDLRRTYATALEALGYPSSGATYKRLLNHLTGRGDVSGGYVNLDIDQLRPAVNRAAEYILSRCQPAAGNVVPLHAHTRGTA